jgi:protocatechuate 3,4-dioxygenase alpha subunit
MPKQTPSQTAGPFFSFSLISGGENVLVNEGAAGERIYVKGRVLDGDGEPVTDALVEIWQADAQGIYNHANDPRYQQVDEHFRGFGRSQTVDDGKFWFKTVKPGPVAGEEGQNQAPHINVRVFARGMLIHAVTRLYFADEEANQTDPVLNAVDLERRPTLLAMREQSEDLPTYRLDIHLQGERETVFFNP